MTDDLDFIIDEIPAPEGDSATLAQQNQKVNTVKMRKGAAATAFEWIQVFLGPMLIVVLLLTFVFRIVNVDGTSMMNTLLNGDKVIVTNLFYQPTDGDIVVISHGQEYPTPIIKRVIATAGQSVKIDYENKQVLVDGVIIEEAYIAEEMLPQASTDANLEIMEVPEGMVYVMGDNRNHSLDSRSQAVGLINETDIIGKAHLIFLPFNRFGYLY